MSEQPHPPDAVCEKPLQEVAGMAAVTEIMRFVPHHLLLAAESFQKSKP